MSSGPCEDYRGALWDIYVDSPFTQPTLKVIELGLQEADDQSRLTELGYDGRGMHVGAKLTCCLGVGLLFQWGGPTARASYAWVETQIARLPPDRARLLHLVSS